MGKNFFVMKKYPQCNFLAKKAGVKENKAKPMHMYIMSVLKIVRLLPVIFRFFMGYFLFEQPPWLSSK